MHPAIRFHDRLAPGWEAYYTKPSFGSRAHALLSMLDGYSLQGKRWLDAGCGSGRLARMLAERGSSVMGMDASRQMVQAARALSSSAVFPNRGSVEFYEIETITLLPMADDSLDGILCSSVIEYLDAPEQCIEEFYRVLRPGGLLLLSAPNRRSFIRGGQKVCLLASRTILRRAWPEYLLWSKNSYTLREIKSLQAKCGLQVSNWKYYMPPIFGFASQSGLFGSLIITLAEKLERG
jgi:2-polyprenyl-6-hydroxyphenyl methylase/3-demethylubiquinone-9 3-methyltransferase